MDRGFIVKNENERKNFVKSFYLSHIALKVLRFSVAHTFTKKFVKLTFFTKEISFGARPKAEHQLIQEDRGGKLWLKIALFSPKKYNKKSSLNFLNSIQ